MLEIEYSNIECRGFLDITEGLLWGKCERAHFNFLSLMAQYEFTANGTISQFNFEFMKCLQGIIKAWEMARTALIQYWARLMKNLTDHQH